MRPGIEPRSPGSLAKNKIVFPLFITTVRAITVIRILKSWNGKTKECKSKKELDLKNSSKTKKANIWRKKKKIKKERKKKIFNELLSPNNK